MSHRFSFEFSVLSFLPLWFSILIACIQSVVIRNQPIGTEMALLIAVPAVLVISVLEIFRIFHDRKPPPEDFEEGLVVVECAKQKTVTTEYILACVLPLYTFNFTNWCSVLQFTTVIGTIVLLYAKYYELPPNIVLELMGYSRFKCRFSDGRERFVLSRKIEKGPAKLNFRALGNDVFLLLPSENNERNPLPSHRHGVNNLVRRRGGLPAPNV